MTTKDRIILASKAWREEKLSLDKDYFRRLSEMHYPKALWISSSESLASIREMTNTDPGEVIIYRNLGSQVREDDISLMAIVEEAVERDHVKHIIICGYSHCSGVRNVIRGTDNKPALREWLKNLRSLYETHYHELKDFPFEQQEKLLSELNIRKQVQNMARIPIIRRAWERTDYPKIFGWYFDQSTGTLKEVFSMEENHLIKQTSTLMENGSIIKSIAS